ncbi:hypothetical protein R3P38DRAFT_3104453 [Favolaschia claudopus]|uniref:F-box domain-containing protein n=1 Tax=Favolaschia claudopus TaxID=2862362 RepID=A0AAV9ZJS9_9AGAR
MRSLPPEIELSVVLYASRMHPRCIPRIMLAARRFREWLKPEIHRTVIISSRAGPKQYLPHSLEVLGMLLHDDSPSTDGPVKFAITHIRKLVLDVPLTESEESLLPRIFTAASGILVAEFHLQTPSVIPLQCLSSVTHLVINAVSFLQGLLSGPPPLLTYLDLTWPVNDFTLDDNGDLLYLSLSQSFAKTPLLTHLSVMASTPMQCIVSSVVQLDKLRVIRVWVDGGEWLKLGIQDSRCVQLDLAVYCTFEESYEPVLLHSLVLQRRNQGKVQ